MGALKSPRPDGLNPIFFQSQWDLIGDSVVETLMSCFYDPRKVVDLNDTLLVLIPKVDKPDILRQYRLINLCNVIYKTMTKVIANRLKGSMNALVAPN